MVKARIFPLFLVPFLSLIHSKNKTKILILQTLNIQMECMQHSSKWNQHISQCHGNQCTERWWGWEVVASHREAHLTCWQKPIESGNQNVKRDSSRSTQDQYNEEQEGPSEKEMGDAPEGKYCKTHWELALRYSWLRHFRFLPHIRSIRIHLKWFPGRGRQFGAAAPEGKHCETHWESPSYLAELGKLPALEAFPVSSTATQTTTIIFLSCC